MQKMLLSAIEFHVTSEVRTSASETGVQPEKERTLKLWLREALTA